MKPEFSACVCALCCYAVASIRQPGQCVISSSLFQPFFFSLLRPKPFPFFPVALLNVTLFSLLFLLEPRQWRTQNLDRTSHGCSLSPIQVALTYASTFATQQLTYNSDPAGAFTQLCAHIGAQGVQVEQIQSLRREVLHGLR